MCLPQEVKIIVSKKLLTYPHESESEKNQPVQVKVKVIKNLSKWLPREVGDIPPWVPSAQGVLASQPDVRETYLQTKKKIYLWNLTWWSYWLGSLCSFQLSVESHMVVILLLLLRTCNLRPQALLWSSLVAKVTGKKKRKRRFLAKEFIIVVELVERWLMWTDGWSPKIDTPWIVLDPRNTPWIVLGPKETVTRWRSVCSVRVNVTEGPKMWQSR